MREFTKEQVNAAVRHIADNPSRDKEQLQAVFDALNGPLFSPFLLAIEKLDDEPSRTEQLRILAAFFTYGICVSETMRELACEPGDYHCLEHHEKNCECTCEITSQVGKNEGVNPAGPRYF